MSIWVLVFFGFVIVGVVAGGGRTSSSKNDRNKHSDYSDESLSMDFDNENTPRINPSTGLSETSFGSGIDSSGEIF